MLEPRGEMNLALEALRADRRSELRMQDLQRNRSVALEVAGEIAVAIPPRPSSRSST